MTKSKGSYLAKNVILFTISGFAPKILSLLLVPLYTSCLTTAEYGVSDLLSTTVSLLFPVLTLDIKDAIVRFALDGKYKKEEVFSISMRITFWGTGIAAVASYLVSLIHIQGLENEYLLFFVLLFLCYGIYDALSLFCHSIDRVDVMVGSSIFSTATTLLGNILFLVCFDWGLTGYLVANVMGNLVGILWCGIRAKLWRFVTWKCSKATAKDMMRFSFPLVFSTIAWWVNSASDRYVMTFMAGVAASGLYAVAYKIPNMLSVFQNIFAQAWSISAIRDFDSEDADGFIGGMYGMMHAVMVVACSGIMLFNIPAAKILYSGDFFEAWKFMPPLLLSVVFNAMSLFIGSIFTAVKDTKTISLSTIVGAVVNTGCNFLFIYRWGGYGAALATMLGYAVVLVMRHVGLRKHIKLRMNWKRDLCAYGLLLVQMILAFWGMQYFVVQLGILCLIAVLHKKEIITVWNFAKKIVEERRRKE